MKNIILLATVVLFAGLLPAADSNPKEAILSASRNLAGKPSYTWKTTVEVPGDPDGTILGKAEKGGVMFLTLSRGDRSFEGVIKGGKGAVKTEDGWKSLTEATAGGNEQSGAVRFVARMLESFKAPPEEVADLAGNLENLQAVDGTYSGGLSEKATEELLLYRTKRGDNGLEISGAKGSVKFWMESGALTKYELKLQGTFSYNGSERSVTRTHTTVMSDIGTTKVNVPEEAAKKL